MGPKRDIVAEVLAAVRAEGLRTVTTFHNHFLWGWYDTWSPLFGANDATDPQLQLTEEHGGLYQAVRPAGGEFVVRAGGD